MNPALHRALALAALLSGCDQSVLVGRLPSTVQDAGMGADADQPSPNSQWKLQPGQQLASRGRPSALVSGDVNGDGQADVLVAQPEAAEALLLLGQAGQLVAAPAVATGAPGQVLALAELGGSAALDLAQASADRAELRVLAGQGDGRFAAPVVHPLPAAVLALAAGDFDGDGATDLVAALADKQLAVLLRRDGDPTVAPVADVRYPLAAAPQALSVLDLDGDRRADVVVASRDTAQLWVFQGSSGGLQAGPSYGTELPPTALAGADLTGDGRPELVVARTGHDVILLKNLGDGRLFWDEKLWPRYVAGPEPRALALGDFDRDGQPDLLSAHAGGAELGFRRGIGGGFAPAMTVYPCDQAPAALAVADLNRDGAPDVVVASPQTRSLRVFLNTLTPL